MANIHHMFPSKYLKAEDLQHKSHRATILQIGQEMMKGDGTPQDLKWVMTLDSKTLPPKGLVLNKTNAGTLAHKFGPETDKWLGQEVEVYPDNTTMQGRIVDCIRVRAVLQQAATEDVEEDLAG